MGLKVSEASSLCPIDLDPNQGCWYPPLFAGRKTTGIYYGDGSTRDPGVRDKRHCVWGVLARSAELGDKGT